MTYRLPCFAALSLCLSLLPAQTGPALVQDAHASGDATGSLVVTLPQPPVQGHVLIVCHDSTSGQNSRLAGGGVTTWRLVQSTVPTQDNSEIWAGVVDGTPDTQVTITLGGSPNSASAVVSEWRGLAVPLVFAGGATNGFGGTVAAPVTTATVSANARDLVIATAGVHSSGNGFGAAGNGFTDLPRPVPINSTLMTAAFRVPTSGGNFATSWALSFNTLWAAAIATFAAAPGPTLRQDVAVDREKADSLTLALPQAPQSGSVLVLCVESTLRSNSSVHGGGVPNWTLCRSSLPAKDHVEIWIGRVGNGTTPPVTVQLGAIGAASAVLSEWRGFSSLPTATSGTLRGSNDTAVTGDIAAIGGGLVVAAVRVGSAEVSIAQPTQGFTALGPPGAKAGGGLAAAVYVPALSGPVQTGWQLGRRDTWATVIVALAPP